MINMRHPILLVIILIHAVSTPMLTGQNTCDFKKDNHESLLKFKQTQKVPGFAFALFDNQSIIFTECAGKSTLGFNINEETLFSIQSISKNITALAVIKAVQKGMLDLDAPITDYLPSFSVNSCFEESPENKITLRMLLSHTAGFTHEAPIGNNYDYSPCEIGDHLKSIESTWLKFPVGINYSYSNLGFDLISSIISQTANTDFNEFLKSEIFQPLGMTRTTINDKEVSQNKNRTDGNIPAVRNIHYSIPLPGSGAVYTNLSDIIKYTQLLMNYGVYKNNELIKKQSILEMVKINSNNYGLGTYVDKQDDIIYINHNGGGFGFSATLLWFPEYNLGSVLLCNRSSNTFDICYSIMNDYVKNINLLKDTSVTSLLNTLNQTYFENLNDSRNSIAYKCNCDSLPKSNWNKYVGKYSLIVQGMDLKWYAKLAHFLGFGYKTFWIKEEDQTLKTSGSIGESVLLEYKPGLFFNEDFEVLDLQSEKKTFRNIYILKKR